MESTLRNLKLLKYEDIIWLIYFFIVIFALVANSLERYDLLNKSKFYEQTAKKINTTLLLIAFFIYLYFVIVSINNLEILKKEAYSKKTRVAFERLIATIIFLVGGAYTLYADFDANTTDVDLTIF